MKLLILCIALLGVVKADTTAWTQIRLKFAFSGALNNINYFWKVGNNLTAAEADGWSIVNTTNDYSLQTACSSQIDVRVCALYDGNGYIAGLQLAIPPSDVDGKNYPYDFRNFTVFAKKLINGVEYWTSIVLVVNPTTLAAGGRTSFTNLGDGLWFKNGSTYTEVPTTESVIATTTSYVKQNCLPNMGTHYSYDPYGKCEESQPFFLMTKRGHINGIGWKFFGKTTPPGRNWYDDVVRQTVQTTFPLSNACLADWTELYGVISFHMYFVDAPWTNTCDQATESAAPITGLLKIGLDIFYASTDLIDTFRLWFHLY